MTRGACVVLMLALCAHDAAAQDEAPGLRPKHLSVAGGVVFAGGYPTGDVTPTLRRNTTGNPPDFTLLRAESTLARVTGLDVRAGIGVTRALGVEVAASYATPQLGITVSQDPEAADGAFVSERVSQYTVDVSGVYHLPIAFARRMRPYVVGGGGYLRQLHEGRLLVETGRTLHAGGGLQVWVRGGSAQARALGARVEARYVRRTGGIDFEDRGRGFPVVHLLAFVGF